MWAGYPVENDLMVITSLVVKHELIRPFYHLSIKNVADEYASSFPTTVLFPDIKFFCNFAIFASEGNSTSLSANGMFFQIMQVDPNTSTLAFLIYHFHHVSLQHLHRRVIAGVVNGIVIAVQNR